MAITTLSGQSFGDRSCVILIFSGSLFNFTIPPNIDLAAEPDANPA